MSTRYITPLLAALLLNAAVSAPTDPALQARNPTLAVTWSAEDLRPAPFDKIMLAPFELQFRAVAPLTGPPGYGGNRTDFPVGAREQQELADSFARIFREELADNPRFTLTDTAGPDVLLIRPALRDIVSRVPPEEPVGRSYVYVDTVGEATLALDFADSTTGRTLGTAMDRREAAPGGGVADFGAVRANKVGAGQEVRRLARRWAMSLENRLEQLYYDAKPK